MAGRPKDGVASLAYVPAIHAFCYAKAWMPGTRPSMTNLTAFDLREIRHGPGRFPYLVQQPQPVGPQILVIDVDRDLFEESIHVGPQVRHRGHGGGEILMFDR